MKPNTSVRMFASAMSFHGEGIPSNLGNVRTTTIATRHKAITIRPINPG